MKVKRLKSGVVLADEICAMGRKLVDGTLSKLLAQLQDDGEQVWAVWRINPESVARFRASWPELREPREIIAELIGYRFGYLYGSTYRTYTTQRALKKSLRQNSLLGFYAVQKSARESLYEEVEEDENEP